MWHEPQCPFNAYKHHVATKKREGSTGLALCHCLWQRGVCLCVCCTYIHISEGTAAAAQRMSVSTRPAGRREVGPPLPTERAAEEVLGLGRVLVCVLGEDRFEREPWGGAGAKDKPRRAESWPALALLVELLVEAEEAVESSLKEPRPKGGRCLNTGPYSSRPSALRSTSPTLDTTGPPGGRETARPAGPRGDVGDSIGERDEVRGGGGGGRRCGSPGWPMPCSTWARPSFCPGASRKARVGLEVAARGSVLAAPGYRALAGVLTGEDCESELGKEGSRLTVVLAAQWCSEVWEEAPGCSCGCQPQKAAGQRSAARLAERRVRSLHEGAAVRRRLRGVPGEGSGQHRAAVGRSRS
ncbi:hypothetical protein E2C01_009365 [Portunus trituberculatus]|uniref:Uncharacterized protein n=1 Tax=Portunus trituberculatus TaxID=210409 RepID=A0A5B7D4P6_PORTR|nr:hypothetical protein [Portunus trituberculatus]